MPLSVSSTDYAAPRPRDRARKPAGSAPNGDQTAASDILAYIGLTPDAGYIGKVASSTGLAIALLGAETMNGSSGG